MDSYYQSDDFAEKMNRLYGGLIVIVSFSIAGWVAIHFYGDAGLTTDTPYIIRTDYRTQAQAALARLNPTLQAEATRLTQALRTQGKTAEADAVAAHLQRRLTGEPSMLAISTPDDAAPVLKLFTTYETDRAQALDAVQKNALVRLHMLLLSDHGKHPGILKAIDKVREEILAGLTLAP